MKCCLCFNLKKSIVICDLATTVTFSWFLDIAVLLSTSILPSLIKHTSYFSLLDPNAAITPIQEVRACVSIIWYTLSFPFICYRDFAVLVLDSELCGREECVWSMLLIKGAASVWSLSLYIAVFNVCAYFWTCLPRFGGRYHWVFTFSRRFST